MPVLDDGAGGESELAAQTCNLTEFNIAILMRICF